MSLFLLLLSKIIPLYLIIIAGYFAGQRLNLHRETVATILIYLIVPVVFFGATAQMELTPRYLLLPLGLFIMTLVVGLGLYHAAGLFWRDGRRNLIGYMMGTANQGYFGVPVFLALFDEKHLGLYILAGLGFSFYENIIGYYLLARAQYSIAESLKRLKRLPLLPAALLGLAFSAAGFHLPPLAKDFYAVFKGAYTVLGMGIIGLGLSSLHHLKSDPKFMGFVFFGKFVCWPLAGLLLAYLYGLVTPQMEPVERQVLVLLGILPVAANVAAFSLHLKVEPEKAASAVVLTTVFALFYIPFIIGYLF